MADQEMLDAIKILIKPITKKLEDLDIKLDTLDMKIDSLQLNQKMTERAIRKDINYLNDEVDTLIAVLEAKNILPKVENL